MTLKSNRLAIAFIAITLSVDLLARDQVVVGALGDSVTTATNSASWGNNLSYSWSTGSSDSVNSHFNRLKGIFSTVQAYNYARAGAVAADLPEQAQKLVRKNPDYVTVLIGANDLCSWSSRDEAKITAVENNVRSSIDIILANNAETKILLIPIPNMYQLWQLGAEHSCDMFWDLTGICSPLLNSDRTEAERLAFMERVDEVNGLYQAMADTYVDNVRFDPVIADQEFLWEHVSSKDCFHPSVKGQKLIADKTWEASWY